MDIKEPIATKEEMQRCMIALRNLNDVYLDEFNRYLEHYKYVVVKTSIEKIVDANWIIYRNWMIASIEAIQKLVLSSKTLKQEQMDFIQDLQQTTQTA